MKLLFFLMANLFETIIIRKMTQTIFFVPLKH